MLKREWLPANLKRPGWIAAGACGGLLLLTLLYLLVVLQLGRGVSAVPEHSASVGARIAPYAVAAVLLLAGMAAAILRISKRYLRNGFQYRTII